jgi:hypothetical protein
VEGDIAGFHFNGHRIDRVDTAGKASGSFFLRA